MYSTPEVIVLKYVSCIHCYYTPEVAVAVYFSSTLSQTWTELMKQYSKVTMKCLSLPALHIFCQEENFVFSCNCMNLHSLRGILRESYWTVNSSYQCRGAATASSAWYLAWFLFKTCCAAASVRVKKINEVVHEATCWKGVFFPPEMCLVNLSARNFHKHNAQHQFISMSM